MKETLQEISELLESTLKKTTEHLPKGVVLSSNYNIWNAPSVDQRDLISKLELLTELFTSNQKNLEDNEYTQAELTLIKNKLTYLNQTTLPNLSGSFAAGAFAYLYTIDAIKKPQ